MEKAKEFPYVLGLDVGANSIGWAILERREGEKDEYIGLSAIRASGARIFEAGVEGDIESGRDESRAKKRREARLMRRQINRRAMRTYHLFSLLQSACLLPTVAATAPIADSQTSKNIKKQQQRAGRDSILTNLDKGILARWHEKLKSESASAEDIRLLPKRLPYVLRARALDQKLEPHEVGRALYHLGQRRGFESNRKALAKKDEDKSVVKAGIKKLLEDMGNVKARTLGEFFSQRNPEEERIRGKWTSRQMYEDEFEQIWKAQSQRHPEVLTDKLKKEIQRAVFFQRPLKIQSHLIGECEYEEGKKRAPMGILAFQRFRILQVVNNLKIISHYQARPLTPEERKNLIEALEGKGDFLDDKGNLSFTNAKKVIDLKSGRFNFDRGTKPKLVGNRTAAKLRPIFGERWDSFSDAERDQVVEDLRSIHKDEALIRRAMKVWGLDEERAKQLAEVELEPGYASLSRQAIAKLLPLMKQGLPYMTAVDKTYDPPPPDPVDLLPPVDKALKQVRNPAVMRSLTELRKLVNTIVKKYGKPEIIRVELARELKNPRPVRKEISEKISANEKAREDAAQAILKEVGLQNPNRRDKDKYLLWEECGHFCPYTGKPISMTDLLGPNPRFDIEHIIPLHRGRMEDSFANKTLCDSEENRRKHNKTPWEGYGSDPQRWEEILGRVKKFNNEGKLRRFQMKEENLAELESSFTDRQLNDTRYASRLAREYLGHLYGAKHGIDAHGKLRVQVSSGGVTAHLRNELSLNRVLSEGGQKSRDDHRHHAVDAMAIALSSPATVKILNDAAKRSQPGHRPFAFVDPPWLGFLDDVRNSILNSVVSHRVSRKVRAALHEETFYSPPKQDPDGKPCRHVRKPLEKMTKNEIEDIVDPKVKEKVQAKLQELKIKDIKKEKPFSNEANLPYLQAKDGRKIPIRKARIRKPDSAFSVGEGPRERHVTTDSNHHLEVIGVFDPKDPEKKIQKWECQVVDSFEALGRLNAKEPVVKNDHGEGKCLVFSLAGGEIIEIDEGEEKKGLYRIRTYTQTQPGNAQIWFVNINDARKIADIKKAKAWKSAVIDTLRELNCRKVVITPLGEVRSAND